MRKAVLRGATLVQLVPLWVDWLASTSSPLGALLRRMRQPLVKRPCGEASLEVFPLPFSPVPGLPVRGRSRERAQQRRSSILWCNCVIAVLNILWCGSSVSVCTFLPSRSQERLQNCLLKRVQTFLRGSARGACGEPEIREYLRCSGGV